MATEMTEVTEVTAALADQRDAITVARVDAPRRRDEVLPEHEERWPVTEMARELIQARYDGTASTSHEIGLQLVTPKHGAYPSWRIEQIAQQLGLDGEKRNAIIERVRAEDAAGKVERSRTPQPMKASSEGKCEICGATFEPWKAGRGLTKRFCRSCFLQKANTERWPRKADPEPEAAPEPSQHCVDNFHDYCGGYNAAGGKCNCSCHDDAHYEPSAEASAEPVYAAGPNFPTFVAAALPVAERDPEPDAPLTFGDLPGSGAVFELMDLLPTNGRWSGKRRYRWLTALTATLDLLIDDDRDDETRGEEVAR